MQTGATHFPDGVQTPQAAGAVYVGPDPTALIMRRWHHWNWRPAHIDPELQTGVENVRKTFTQKRLGLVRDVQINALRTAAFDLGIDCTRHYIARGQRATRVISRHEILAAGITQDSPFAADCFRNQKRTLFSVE